MGERRRTPSRQRTAPARFDPDAEASRPHHHHHQQQQQQRRRRSRSARSPSPAAIIVAQGGGSDGSADEDEDDEIHSDSEEVGWTAEDEEEYGFALGGENIDSDADEVGWTEEDDCKYPSLSRKKQRGSGPVGTGGERDKLSPAVQRALRISRDTSWAYLLPAATACYLQLPHWERRSAAFAAAAVCAATHHAYEYKNGVALPLLNKVDIFFATSAAIIEVRAGKNTRQSYLL